MKILAIIPARGGSKRIANKNIKLFLDKPIISYSILAAQKSGIFDEIVVSTDSKEIASIADDYGAKVPFLRSERNSDDFATTTDVILEVVDKMRNLGKNFDFVCCIYPTAPFVNAAILKEAFDILRSTDANSVFPITAFSYPPQRAVVIDDNNYLKFLNKEYEFTRSQDLDKHYHDAGQFYFLRTATFLAEKGLVLSKTVPIIVDELKVQDIDNETDWRLAEMKYQIALDEGK